MSEVVTVPFKRNDLSALAEEIRACVQGYAGRIALAEAVGVLEIVKHELLREHGEAE